MGQVPTDITLDCLIFRSESCTSPVQQFVDLNHKLRTCIVTLYCLQQRSHAAAEESGGGGERESALSQVA